MVLLWLMLREQKHQFWEILSSTEIWNGKCKMFTSSQFLGMGSQVQICCKLLPLQLPLMPILCSTTRTFKLELGRLSMPRHIHFYLTQNHSNWPSCLSLNFD